MENENKQDCSTQGCNPIICRSIQFSALNHRMNDAWGISVYPTESMMDTFQTLGWAAEQHVIEGFSAWDDDFLPWSADNRGQVLDSQDHSLLEIAIDFIKDSHLKLTAFGCDLARDPIFRNGALTNPDEKIRQLAYRKIERAIHLARALAASSFRLLIARDGYDEVFNVSWKEKFKLLAEGLNHTSELVLGRSHIRSIELMTGGRLGLRNRLFVENPVQAAMMLSRVPKAGCWKVCLEDDKIDNLSSFAVLAASKSLAFMPFGGRGDWAGHVGNMVVMLRTLKELGWSGVAECTAVPLRNESDPGEREFCKRQFIVNAMTALTAACEQVKKLDGDWDNGMSQSEAGVMSIIMLNSINADEILKKTVSCDRKQPEAETKIETSGKRQDNKEADADRQPPENSGNGTGQKKRPLSRREKWLERKRKREEAANEKKEQSEETRAASDVSAEAVTPVAEAKNLEQNDTEHSACQDDKANDCIEKTVDSRDVTSQDTPVENVQAVNETVKTDENNRTELADHGSAKPRRRQRRQSRSPKTQAQSAASEGVADEKNDGVNAPSVVPVVEKNIASQPVVSVAADENASDSMPDAAADVKNKVQNSRRRRYTRGKPRRTAGK